MGRRERLTLEQRRRLRRGETVEEAVARGQGLAVSEQMAMSRNMAVWGGGMLSFAAACFIPGASHNLASGWGMLEAVTAVPAGVLFRRAWLMQRTLRDLQDENDPGADDGDDELAHLRQLVRSLEAKNAVRVGKSAITAAQRGYAERRRILERRAHVEALLADADPHLGLAALQADLDGCNAELQTIDNHLLDLIEAVTHLAASADQSQDAAIASVRDTADAVHALASAYDELRQQSPSQ
ncbi:MAG TPA: hypothetical protein VHD87_13735 [Acidimicrobiales bacterium]|nr:hypothetical protein [Acidimicrobiales bacterium]